MAHITKPLLMLHRRPLLGLLILAGAAHVVWSGRAADTSAGSPGAGPDPREIPVPPISSPMGRLPGPGELPVHQELPDVLTMNDGTKVTSPEQWKRRREEMRRILEYYATGQMPPPPGNVKGHEVKSEMVADNSVRYRLVRLTLGPEEKLSLDVGIFTPAGAGPFPAIIAQSGTPPGATPLPRLPLGPTQGRGQDVLLLVGSGTNGAASPASAPVIPGQEPGAPAPATPGRRSFSGAANAEDVALRNREVFRRGYAIVMFNNNDCAEDTTLRNADGSWAFRNTRFFPAYPGYDWGILAAWAWGVSRIADYLQTDSLIDKTKLIITGASRAGKAAMIAAAFDDRLMGAPVVTGGGGIGAYRFAGPHNSETLDTMMKKYPNWFSPNLHEFWGRREKLPFDQHWFLALCAPHPFIALEGDTDTISLPDAVKHSFLGAQPAYDLLGAKDRLGVHYSHHGHAFTQEDWTALMDFADKHLRGMKVERAFDRFPVEEASARRSYNVRDFGATGDGTNKDTVAFQKALDACAVKGGGEVIVPAGKYLIGSVQMGTRTILRLEKQSVIAGSPDAADYPMMDVRWEGRWQPGRRALIYSANVEQTGIVGPGRIEGNPGVAAPQNPRGSVVLEPISCNDVRWEDFTVTQGGNWATHPTYCTDVMIKGVTIRGNRDGIDLDSCKNVRLESCDIDTGDDSISLKSGRGLNGARLAKPTEDVLITNCVLKCRVFAGIVIGSETSGGIRNVRIRHCQFTCARSYAIYIKTRIGRGGVIENISGDDLDVLAGGLLRVNLVGAGNLNTVDDPVEGLIGYPLGRNFRFSNIHVACTTLADVTQVSPEKPLEGLVLENVTGTCTRGIAIQHVQNAVLSGINVTGSTGPFLATADVTGRGLENAVPYIAPRPAPGARGK